MASNGNGFARTVFWTLILASFGWTTVVLGINAKISNAYSAEAKADILKEETLRAIEDKEIKQDIIKRDMEQRVRDEKILVAITKIAAKLGVKDGE